MARVSNLLILELTEVLVQEVNPRRIILFGFAHAEAR